LSVAFIGAKSTERKREFVAVVVVGVNYGDS